MDGNSIMQMYNHLASVAPPGVGSASGVGGTAQYSSKCRVAREIFVDIYN